MRKKFSRRWQRGAPRLGLQAPLFGHRHYLLEAGKRLRVSCQDCLEFGTYRTTLECEEWMFDHARAHVADGPVGWSFSR